MRNDSPAAFNERLWPSPLLLMVLLLLLPSVTMIVYALSPALAIPIAIAVYLIIAGSLVLMSPTIAVKDGYLHAGNAKVPVSVLSETTVLNDAKLRNLLGPGADVRAYMVVRGHIHQGLRVDLNDPQDPTPYWVLTTRRPNQLSAAIQAAQGATTPAN